LLKNLAGELGVVEHLRFMGYTADVEQVLPQYDALVVPSRGEAFPLVVLEGMAAGLPIVASRCGGPEDMIEDGVSGKLVNVGDYRRMALAIDQILGDRDYAAAMAREARSTAARSFDSKRQFQKISRLILSKQSLDIVGVPSHFRG
jgi:glycosyltransferase involved in cell wall biosynthesis